ncbi:amino acid permease [Solirubrobacter sp. CPCC 204708]|uniref:Amino acid permease n=1 Tax=Solirubrobacter deserti TaxID=2282478 RepID=A0ABT4RCY7_9ACTN|nr:amino acid permease [Solirubrobacter deserti]MBE2317841.1 amino acid permease [Solirubrobacter deserti]MDA0136382.1 amino acid permease [Solirubrobacter deserti]
MLTTRTAIALYVGAVLGPGVLFIPAVAAREAGPASVLAWAALLALSVPLAATFAALGTRQPEAGGTAAYVRRAFGRRAGATTGWWFLGGVMIGAPAVALVGGFYVAELLDAGRGAAVAAAVAMIAIVLAANAASLHTTARLQLGLAAVLGALLLVAVVTALPHGQADNWTPFAPNGWLAIGGAASVLMFSFVGWEAGSHLAGELKDPARQLPRAIGAAVAIVIVLYLGLAAATIGVGTTSDVPLADLMGAGLGEAGRTLTALLAVLLTMGTMNTYVAAATRLAGALAEERNAPSFLVTPKHALAAMAAISGTLLLGLAVELMDVDALLRATSALFVAVYVTATAAGSKLLEGAGRAAARVAFVAVLVVFAFSGAYILLPLAFIVVASVARRFVRASVATPV